MQRIRGQSMPRKKGCCLISLAPVCDPKRLPGSRFNNAFINCLAARLTCITKCVFNVFRISSVDFKTDGKSYFSDIKCIVDTGMLLGKVRSLRKMLENVFCLFLPLKGVRPYSISYSKMPRLHSRNCTDKCHCKLRKRVEKKYYACLHHQLTKRPPINCTAVSCTRNNFL